MAILVTGGTGFADHNPVEALLARDDGFVIELRTTAQDSEFVISARWPGDVCCVRLVADTVRRRWKNAAADTEAICAAVRRPTMRFVAVKTAEQQSVLDRPACCLGASGQLAHAIRGHLAQNGIVALIGREELQRLIETMVDESAERRSSVLWAQRVAGSNQAAPTNTDQTSVMLVS